ncbi:tripartite motif-containing protein 3-like isoform X2 [Ruditapes philippinarum]|uniref:tripartite motif-containing protein 3-like isoform X2 n=1 Tax=Ruditapes philippinarum TaxID=129788 RepID=UPI00295BD211|nr:tripartite motif-containing protein 3-like isoform X2 [Ruditapes philippinarum]
MVDFQSHFRMYGHGYTSPDLRAPVSKRREENHHLAQILFHRRPTAHDCRINMIKDHEGRNDWEAWLLSHGLSATCRSVDDMHYKEIVDPLERKPDKLLTTVGLRGTLDGDFVYPRGLTVTADGYIIVADSGNNRIQVISNFGVFMKKFGKKGKKEGEFDEPTGVTELPNGDIAVADKNNKRVQVFSESYEFKYQFPTSNKPYCIASDRNFNIVVSTVDRGVEVYRRTGKLLHKFRLAGRSRGPSGLPICVNEKEEVIVCDPLECLIKMFTYSGKLLYKFQPTSNKEGLSVIPSGITITPLDQIVVADTLNHTVNLYTERGVLLKELLCPTDDTGCIQACALGPEGHLITSEYSILGQHCIKIFRYRPCTCHATRPGSSKRRTPTTLV